MAEKSNDLKDTIQGCGCLIIVAVLAGVFLLHSCSRDDSSSSESSSKPKTEKVVKQAKQTSNNFVTSKQVYNNALILVAQDGDKTNGIANSLAGFKFQQEYALTKIHDTFYQYRNNPNAKKNGIVIVSYASGDVFSVFYAAPSDLTNISQFINNDQLKPFIENDITGYYINGLYLNSAMGSDYKFLKDVPLVNQDNMPDWVKQDISTGSKKFN